MAGRARLALFALLALATPALAQVSPGKLSRPHRELEGNANCLKCHGPRRERGVDAQCLACHREIGWLIDRQRGLHGRESSRDCAECHPEHGGLDFDLLPWKQGEAERFDHRRTGFELAGRHARLECAECHRVGRFRVSEGAKLAPGKLGARSHLGLEPNCRACHDDPHRGGLGPDCSRCHSAENWRVANFDHGTTAFPLAGKHAAVPCDKCHRAPGLDLPKAADGRPLPLFKPLPHAECSDCHRDPHAGRLGPACAGCHNPASWREIDPRRFAHDRTRYPLRGRHADVACAKCHQTRAGARVERPPFDRCAACHIDPHSGQATVRGVASDCARCHDVAGFKSSTFTADDHGATTYPLTGLHRAVACAKCHRPAGGTAPPEYATRVDVQFRPRSSRCTDCHADPHGGQLAGRTDLGKCEGCHTTAGFKPSSYSAEAHREVFALEGKHATTPCAGCHGPQRRGLPPPRSPEKTGRAGVDFRLGMACEICHRDPHDGRYAKAGARPTADGCRTCHSFDAFRPAAVSLTTHAALGFALEGAHRAVPCVLCHRELERPAGGKTLLLDSGGAVALVSDERRRTCAGCHKDPHGGQFERRANGGRCDACHDVERWRPASRFDHARDSRFVLDGAHAKVACDRCHLRSSAPSGEVVVVYNGTPRRCQDCHAKLPGGLPFGATSN